MRESAVFEFIAQLLRKQFRFFAFVLTSFWISVFRNMARREDMR